MEFKKILPPFNEETAKEKVRVAQEIWNTCNPHNVVKAYTMNSIWRNRTELYRKRCNH